MLVRKSNSYGFPVKDAAVGYFLPKSTIRCLNIATLQYAITVGFPHTLTAYVPGRTGSVSHGNFLSSGGSCKYCTMSMQCQGAALCIKIAADEVQPQSVLLSRMRALLCVRCTEGKMTAHTGLAARMQPIPNGAFRITQSCGACKGNHMTPGCVTWHTPCCCKSRNPPWPCAST